MSKIQFAPVAYTRYDASQTLPAKFERMLKSSGLGEKVAGKTVAIKMHVGDNITFSTIPPVFVRILVSYIKENGGKCFVTDHYVADRHPENRGYTDGILGCPVSTPAATSANISTPRTLTSAPSGTSMSPDTSTTQTSSSTSPMSRGTAPADSAAPARISRWAA